MWSLYWTFTVLCGILLIHNVVGSDEWNPKCVYQQGTSYLDLNALTGLGSDQYSGDFAVLTGKYWYAFQPCRTVYSTSSCGNSNLCQADIEKSYEIASSNLFTLSQNSDGSFAYTSFSTVTSGGCSGPRKVNVTIVCDSNQGTPTFTGGAEPSLCTYSFTLTWNCMAIYPRVMSNSITNLVTIRGSNLGSKQVWLQSTVQLTFLFRNSTAIIISAIPATFNGLQNEISYELRETGKTSINVFQYLTSNGVVSFTSAQGTSGFYYVVRNYFSLPYSYTPTTINLGGGSFSSRSTAVFRFVSPNLKIYGTPTTVIRDGFVVDGSGSFEMYNVSFSGMESYFVNPNFRSYISNAYSSTVGIMILNTNNVTISGCQFGVTSTLRDGVGVVSNSINNNTQITLTNNFFNSDMGFVVNRNSKSNSVEVSGNTFMNVTETNVNFYYSTIVKAVVKNNIFTGNGTGFISGNVESLELHDNQFSGMKTGLWFEGYSVNATIFNNEFNGTLGNTIVVKEASNAGGNLYTSKNRFNGGNDTVVSFETYKAFDWVSNDDLFQQNQASCINSRYSMTNMEISSNFTNNVPGPTQSLISSLGSKDLSLNRNIQIWNSVFTSNRCYRIFDISGSPVHIENSTFTNNECSNKGVTVTYSPFLNVLGSTFTGNSAITGAAISVDSTPFFVSRSRFLQNSARIDGGAINVVETISSEDISIEFSDFVSNSALASGGAISISGYSPNVIFSSINATSNTVNGKGGAICMTGVIVDSFRLENCTIDKNKAGDSGGGLIFDGEVTTPVFQITQSSFTRNSAQNGGGGCLIAGSASKVFVSSSIWSLNKAGTVAAGLSFYRNIQEIELDLCEFSYNLCDALGGGLVLQVEGESVKITNSSFNSNSAPLIGGAIHVPANGKLNSMYIDASEFHSNVSPIGAGFSLRGNVSKVVVSSSSFQENTGADGAAISLDGNALDNVSIYNSTFEKNFGTRSSALYISANTSTLALSNNSFIANTGAQGPIYLSAFFNQEVQISGFFEQNVADFGGAISIVNAFKNSSFSVSDSHFNDNSGTTGGSIYFQTVGDSNLLVDSSHFERNIATDGTIFVNVKGASSSSLISISGSEFLQNSAEIGSTLKASGINNKIVLNKVIAEKNTGDAVFIGGITNLLQVSSSEFTENVGSCINSNATEVQITSALFRSNKGVGMKLLSYPSSQFFLIDSHFQNNSATDGPAVSISGNFEEFIVQNSTFEDNQSQNNAAFYSYGTSNIASNKLNISGSYFRKNSGKNGGAIAVLSTSEISILDSEFTQNVADLGGSLFLPHDPEFYGSGLLFQSNSASKGGALYIIGSSNQTANEITFMNCKFLLNSANEGGTLYTRSDTDVDIITSLFEGNTATEKGNGFSFVGYFRLFSSSVQSSSKRQNPVTTFFVAGDSVLDVTQSSLDSNGMITMDPGTKVLLIGASLDSISCPSSTFAYRSEEGFSSCEFDNNATVTTQPSEFSSSSKGNIIENVDLSDKYSFSVGAIIGIVIGLVVILLIFALIGLFLWTRLRRANREEGSEIKMGAMMESLMVTDVDVGAVIGKGYFGEVYVGSWNGLAVALKGVDEEEEESSRKWREEIKLLHKLNHPNIVRLLGLYEHQSRLFMVMEFADHGSLDSFLKKYKGQLRMEDLTRMSYEVARGMQYLEKKKVLHRDLASRNLLLDGLLHVKITDFGMSREDSVYQAKSRTLPFRWCAPEVLSNGSSTNKSDVWSFGVTVWEIFSFAAFPYEQLTNEQVIENTVNPEGERLSKPDLCPLTIWALIVLCWRPNPDDRPSFRDICEMMVKTFPELIVQVVKEEDINSNSGNSEGGRRDSGTYTIITASDIVDPFGKDEIRPESHYNALN